MFLDECATRFRTADRVEYDKPLTSKMMGATATTEMPLPAKLSSASFMRLTNASILSVYTKETKRQEDGKQIRRRRKRKRRRRRRKRRKKGKKERKKYE